MTDSLNTAEDVRVIGFNGSSTVNEVTTVLEALEAAGLSPDVEVRLRGQQVTDVANTPVQSGDTISASPAEVKAGR
jgi:hypothetical protein